MNIIKEEDQEINEQSFFRIKMSKSTLKVGSLRNHSFSENQK